MTTEQEIKEIVDCLAHLTEALSMCEVPLESRRTFLKNIVAAGNCIDRLTHRDETSERVHFW